jgi:Arc/MetJ family transcription regulator
MTIAACLTLTSDDAKIGARRISVRTTLNLDDELIQKAAELTGRSEKSLLVRLGLEALIARESALRLAQLGGSDPEATAAQRHRGAR